MKKELLAFIATAVQQKEVARLTEDMLDSRAVGALVPELAPDCSESCLFGSPFHTAVTPTPLQCSA